MKQVLFLIFTIASTLVRADDIALGEPAYGGTGCPQGTVGTTLSPDNKVLSVIFDAFMAQAGKGAGVSIDRKTCNLAVPVHVPQGLSVSVLKVDYRGYTYVPSGAMARFNVEYFLKASVVLTLVPKVQEHSWVPSTESTLSLTRLVWWELCGLLVDRMST